MGDLTRGSLMAVDIFGSLVVDWTNMSPLAWLGRSHLRSDMSVNASREKSLQ